MIAMTSKKGQMVRLSADYHLDTEKAYYNVWCEGVEIEFDVFAPAARTYKDLSELIESGINVVGCLNNHIRAARLLGYKIR